ncbi:transcription termination factor 4, mitochondrial [Struthio camelus]|uniref:transcription termination factor 4, mitochondrial n=1 Tax=Struthio camelus TaxID=8801 RepID=UPI003603F29C
MAAGLLRAWRQARAEPRLPRALLAAAAASPSAGLGLCGGAGGGEPDPLLALGFSQAQAARLRAPQPPAPHAQRRLQAAAQQLLLLGLSAEGALRVLEGCPDLLRLPPAQLEARAHCLRRLGLGRGELPRVLSRCPQLFRLPRRRLEAAARLLRRSCLFTAEQLAEALRTCPDLLLEEPRRLEQRFQYAYFRMGVPQAAMVKAGLFRTPFGQLRNRHVFLERLGLYQTPRKGQGQSSNPKLKEILHLPEGDFLASVARSTPEEYEVFKKLLAREEEEEMEEEEREEEEEEDEDALYAEGDEDWDGEGARR